MVKRIIAEGIARIVRKIIVIFWNKPLTVHIEKDVGRLN